ncbi:MAG: hypothetical protein M1831_006098 [Alyxoria varia]|nr:MAG: hypothetical protein M1831_006098 [Alyxoria varia]
MAATVRLSVQQDASLVVRAKPRTWELKGHYKAPPIMQTPATNCGQSYPLKITPDLMDVAKEDWKVILDMKDQLAHAYSVQHKGAPTIQVETIWAIWGDLGKGGSFTMLEAENARETLELVGKGSPWAYLVFDHATVVHKEVSGRMDIEVLRTQYKSDGAAIKCLTPPSISQHKNLSTESRIIMAASTASQPTQQSVSILVRAKPRTWELNGAQRSAIPKEDAYLEESFPVQITFKINLPEPPSMEAWKKLLGIKDQIRNAFNEHHIDHVAHEMIRAHEVTKVWVIWGDLSNGGSFSGLNIFDFKDTLQLLAKAGPWAYLVFDFNKPRELRRTIGQG